MRIWLTGSGGFLGTRLSRRLAEEGHRVLGLSRRPSSAGEENEIIDLASVDAQKTLTSLAQKWGHPEVILHAAGKTMGPGGWSEFVRDNLQTTANLIDLAGSQGQARFVYVSTMDLYGRPDSIPAGEEDPVHPAHPYHWSKYWAEEAICGSAFGASAVILRLPSLFGAGQADSFIDGLARTALAGEDLELFARGEIIRDALHVDDAVEGLVRCLDIPPGKGFTRINLGCGRPIRVVEWARALVEALGSSSRIVPVDRPSPRQADLHADITRAGELIGFAPTPLKETMERYARELQAQS